MNHIQTQHDHPLSPQVRHSHLQNYHKNHVPRTHPHQTVHRHSTRAHRRSANNAPRPTARQRPVKRPLLHPPPRRRHGLRRQTILQRGKSANDDTVSPSPVLLYVDGNYSSLESKRSFCDASGLPLFDLYHKSAGVTWYVELPGGASGTPIMRLAPRAISLKDKLEVTVHNAAANGEEVTLHVQGRMFTWVIRLS